MINGQKFIIKSKRIFSRLDQSFSFELKDIFKISTFIVTFMLLEFPAEPDKKNMLNNSIPF